MLQPLSDYLAEKFTRPPTMATARKWCEAQKIPSEKINDRWYVIVSDQPKDDGVDQLVKKVLRG